MSYNVPFVSETILGSCLTEDDGFAVPSSTHFDKVDFEIGMDEARVQPPAPTKPCLFFQSIQEFHNFARLNPPMSVGENISIIAVILQPTSPGFFKLHAQPTEVLVPAGLSMFLNGYPYANIFDPFVFCGGDSGLPKEFPQAAPQPAQSAPQPAPQPAQAAPQTQNAPKSASSNVPPQDSSRDAPSKTSENPQQKSSQATQISQELIKFHGPWNFSITSRSGSRDAEPKEVHPAVPQPSKRALKQRAKRRARQEIKKQRHRAHNKKPIRKAQKEAMMAEAAKLKAARKEAARRRAQQETANASQVCFSHYHHSKRLASFFEYLPLFLEERHYRRSAALLPCAPSNELPLLEVPACLFSICAGETPVSSPSPKPSAWCGLLKTRRKTKSKKARPNRRSRKSWV
ncbi:uncharacterized protein CXQ87_001239 [Candidozyma duobushaemuli]|uniref:Uncharacterized protein n=2 Tax=Candidozyma TaxID=3303203 RepID=A0ABX8I1E2_9ASCO|nr:uncharacterized protein CXQ87_001239 [[Candida] duobushaemulonis]PVH18319.1 hypothetical protein CXQ87_001239 [[Candida] duobushaemulonis]QWU86867.1 hypothetical protein CA3LBN_001085 [[Candida] haemuloni]